jgi:hypothetical protein
MFLFHRLETVCEVCKTGAERGGGGGGGGGSLLHDKAAREWN